MFTEVSNARKEQCCPANGFGLGFLRLRADGLETYGCGLTRAMAFGVELCGTRDVQAYGFMLGSLEFKARPQQGPHKNRTWWPSIRASQPAMGLRALGKDEKEWFRFC